MVDYTTIEAPYITINVITFFGKTADNIPLITILQEAFLPSYIIMFCKCSFVLFCFLLMFCFVHAHHI